MTVTNYVTGNCNKINGEFMINIYPIGPFIPKPAVGEVFYHNEKIVVANSWTGQIIETFENEKDFFNSCDSVSGSANPNMSNGWD